jgi:aspartate carbamoyltransferase catalytic subunit
MTVATFAGRDMISMRDFDKQQITDLLAACVEFETEKRPLLKDRVLGTLFFEPSTRTRLSFESAMKRLGGASIGFADQSTSSTMKGESLWDTIKVVEGYCDAIVIRHPAEGSARLAAEAATIPVINGGDGANQHPTQTLLDLYTIWKRAGRIDGLKVAFVGDLKYGRTVHSLIRSLSLFGCRFWLISPSSLSLPAYILEDLDAQQLEAVQAKELAAIPSDIDILYVTRIQRERFPDPVEFEQVRNAYQLDESVVDGFSDKLTLMHPLPRTNELDRSLDSRPGSAYFDQAHNGVVVRKTILALLLGAKS